MELGVFILFILVIVLSVVNPILAKKKKYVVIGNVVLYSVLVFLVVFGCIDTAGRARDAKEYKIYGNEYANHFYFEREEGGYYIIRNTAFLAESEQIAVQKETVQLPWITKVYSRIFVYCEEGADLQETTVMINAKEYRLGEEIVKIRPHYLELLLVVGAGDFLLLALFNVGCLLVLLGKKRKTK